MRRSSTSEPQPEPVFFTDRDLGRSVAAALRAGGLQVQAYHEHFSLDDVPDREWLRYVGEKGWSALSHNKYIRYERDELDDLMKFGVQAFFIIGKGPHSAFAAAVLRNVEKIYRLIQAHTEPFVAKSTSTETRSRSGLPTPSGWKQDAVPSQNKIGVFFPPGPVFRCPDGF